MSPDPMFRESADSGIAFRGLRGRNLADQADALAQGYTSMTEYAIDELGRLLHETIMRVDALEEQLGLANERLNASKEGP